MDTKSYFKKLFALHIIYMVFVMAPIFVLDFKIRLYCVYACSGITLINLVLELVPITVNAGVHFEEEYNVVDLVQIFA